VSTNTSLYLLAITELGLLSGSVIGEEHKAEHVWDYSESLGPTHWGDLKPEFAACRDGHRQSPIDIRSTKKAELPAIEFHFKPSPLRIIDNGHTVMINYAQGSFIRVGGKQYELKQFHFHRPSEEKIEGHTFEMEAHLVLADADGNLAVIAILLDKGGDNSLIRELWSDFPKDKEKETMLENVRIDLSNLLPENRDYYTFAGSLTTPPCSEDVTWFVLKQPVTISKGEIEQFAKLYRNDARPTQPLNSRVVLESQ
jgi:carbonic anhydrase